MIVACHGYIVDRFGPYKATTSDAEMMCRFCIDITFRGVDVFILDRGFRDIISLLEGCGYRTCMPESLLEGKH